MLPVGVLGSDDVDRMFALMVDNYDNVSRARFERDLSAKDGVLLVIDEDDVIQGFSTYRLIETVCQGTRVRVLFSGDTIVERSCWGQTSLFKSFARLISGYMKDLSTPLYWFLITKGIRTYLMLPLYFREFYPRADVETPSDVRAMIEYLSRELFGDLYLRDHGIIRVGADRLKPELAAIPETKRGNASVEFYLQANPGFVVGDELPSIARLDWDNLTPAALRFMRNV